MDKRNFAFDRTNFIMIAVSMVIVIIGFILMSGGNSDAHTFDQGIFSTMRVKVAPVVCFVGFVSLIAGIMRKPKTDEANTVINEDNKATIE